MEVLTATGATQTGKQATSGKQVDLIATKFNQLAGKILAELQQQASSARFFARLDAVLLESEHPRPVARGQLTRSSSRRQLAEQRELERKCDILLAKQRAQQDQLDSHQQILFDQQYESLPDTTSSSNHKKSAPTSKQLHGGAGGAKSRSQVRKTATTSQLTGGQHRSAIPTSTVLAGLNQLAKSATTGSVAGLTRQMSLRLKHPARVEQTDSRSLSPAERLKQRRPTQATLRPELSIETDEDEDDDDEEEDDSYEYHNLASRRAYLNERFVSAPQSQPQSQQKQLSHLVQPQKVQQVLKSKTFSELKQRDEETRPQEVHDTRGASFEDSDGPRSINVLAGRPGSGATVTYKPHMNYSQSLLGNHRLSDDDEIIIIPTARSPTPSLLMSSTPSPVHPAAAVAQQANLVQQQQQQQQHHQMSNNDNSSKQTEQEPMGNLDEFNERFSISRTKSFWEKLASTKKVLATDATTSEPNNKLKASQQRQHSSGTTTSHNNFDRLDSTGGSGNSHYSGCSSNSSTSGDESARCSAPGTRSTAPPPPSSLQQQQQKGAVARSRAVNQLRQQEQLLRSDRFRQTR